MYKEGKKITEVENPNMSRKGKCTRREDVYTALWTSAASTSRGNEQCLQYCTLGGGGRCDRLPPRHKNIHNIHFPRKLSGMPSASAGAWTRVSDEGWL